MVNSIWDGYLLRKYTQDKYNNDNESPVFNFYPVVVLKYFY